MKIISIVGARPQFIKAAPFSEAFRRDNQEVLVHTGQHYDANMSDIFFEELRIPRPDYNLAIGSGNHGMQTGKMLEKIEEIIIKEKPDGVVVYGDTNSTLAGALAASKLHVPVFHIEAGLRSYNKLMPEEQNRVLTDHISSLLLCPTQTAVNNLKKEGITSGVFNTGDIMYDAVLRNIEISKNKYSGVSGYAELRKENENIPDLKEKKYYLATIHRAENTDDLEKLKRIFLALEKLEYPTLFPLHPRTEKLVRHLDISFKNIIFIKPVGYLMMLYLVANAYMVVTDSGGLQKEAYFLKTPCTTLREQTEWVETLENSWNALSKIDVNEIVRMASRELSCIQHEQPPVFGDGHAAEKICEVILSGG